MPIRPRKPREILDGFGEMAAEGGQKEAASLSTRAVFLLTLRVMTEIIINGTGDLSRAARAFLAHKGPSNVVAFYGSMGAGKTTFITALCRELGVRDDVGSPTFTLVNEYRDRDDNPVYHFDFYRINRLSEAVDIGVFEYFDSGDLCLVEWPEMIEELLPEDTLKVRILVEDAETRTLLF